MVKIKEIKAREILDSRGNPTVEAQVVLSDGTFAIASVPSGASTGEREAMEKRDGDKKRFFGKGVLGAVKNVNEIIAPKLVGQNPFDQGKIDSIMLALDGTEFKTKLGANAILAVSMAVCRASAISKKLPLYAYLNTFFESKKMCMPRPMFNVINGGAHASSSVDFQEFMIVPTSAKTFREAYKVGAEVFASLKKLLKSKNLLAGVGDEGGFAPNVSSNEMPLKLIAKAVSNAGYKLGVDVAIALDVAASEFFDEKTQKYNLNKSGEGTKSAQQLISIYKRLIKKYSIISIEDPFDQNDKRAFCEITKQLGGSIQIVGDDLFVTNVKFIEEGIKQKQANSVLIKLNQIGSVSETINAIKLAQKNKMQCIISHRSGETEDTFIADLAVASGAGEIKSGSLSRGERIAKYNALQRIEENECGKIKLFSLKKFVK